MNNVQLIGRLTRDVDLRKTSKGTSVATFNLAVRRPFSVEDEADFIQCVIWKKAAESLSQYAHQGSKIGITGRLQARSYTNNHGIKVFVTEVIVNSCEFLDSKQQETVPQPSAAPKYQPYAQMESDEAAAKAQEKATPDPFKETGDLDISAEDLPF